jgi:ferredoxin
LPKSRPETKKKVLLLLNIDYALCQGCGGCAGFPQYFEIRDTRIVNRQVAARTGRRASRCPYYAIVGKTAPIHEGWA